MKCVVAAVNIKIFGKAVHSLARIGEEIYFEPMENGLLIKTVNMTKSAYTTFLFSPTFFESYDDSDCVDTSQVPSADQDEANTVKCKINMRSFSFIFKNTSQIEKGVTKCKIKLNTRENCVQVRLYCKFGVKKKYDLRFIESESLQAVYQKGNTKNCLVAHAKLLNEVITNFPAQQEEISLIVNKDGACFKSYVDDVPDAKKQLRTEMKLQPTEFDQYRVVEDAEITFCLKEFRAMLLFSDSISVPVSLDFDSAGRPVIFSMEQTPYLEATFVLATQAVFSSSGDRVESQSTVPSQGSVSFPANNQSRSSASAAVRPDLSRAPSVQKRPAERNQLANRRQQPAMMSVRDDVIPETNSEADNSHFGDDQRLVHGANGNGPSERDRREASTSHNSGAGNDLDQAEVVWAEEEGSASVHGTVPVTPPSKRLKSFLFASYDSADMGEILASDSDPEPEER